MLGVCNAQYRRYAWSTQRHQS
uniref:Uncharacterized protein n=1 Tax=Anguilla anguilla TaxID=7936 RepID=A0A0E9UJT1_ANGAN